MVRRRRGPGPWAALTLVAVVVLAALVLDPTPPEDRRPPELRTVASYPVEQARLGPPTGEVDDADAQLHAQLWGRVRDVAPDEMLAEVTRFDVVSDGREEILATVDRDPATSTTWTLALDVADRDDPEFVHTIVHELAHVRTLGEEVFARPGLWFAAGPRWREEVSRCRGHLSTGGCVRPQALLGRFAARFWTRGVVDADIDQRLGDDPDGFVSEYAAEHPDEDLAESLATYVLAGVRDGPGRDKLAWLGAQPEARAFAAALRDHGGLPG